MDNTEFDNYLKHPFTCTVVGGSKTGKTEFVKKLIRNADEMIVPPPEKIIWYFMEMQPGYDDLKSNPKVELVEGLPNVDKLKFNRQVPKLIIFDDCMLAFSKDNTNSLAKIYTQGSHHWNISAIHIVQNCFENKSRTSRINTQYIVLMRNPSDKSQVRTLASHIMESGKDRLRMLEAYKDACSTPYSYLLIDMNAETHDNFRLRTDIFPGELQSVYLPKDYNESYCTDLYQYC